MLRPLRFSTARQVFEAFPPAIGDIEAAPTDDHPLVFLRALLDGPTPEDAISFCAYMLPRREAVWWACQCVRQIESPLHETDEDLLSKTEIWVRDPDEQKRLEIKEAAAKAAVNTPAAWIAMAAAWSGGSLSGPGNPPVPPPPYLTAQAVRAAVLTSLARIDRHERRDYLVASVKGALKLVDPDVAEFSAQNARPDQKAARDEGWT